MQIKQPALCRAYCRRMSKALSNAPRLRKRLNASMAGSISEFLEEHPDADFDALCARYGMPEQAAQEALQAADPDELAEPSRRKSKWLIVLVIISAALAAVVAFFILTRGVMIIEKDTYYTINLPQDVPMEDQAKQINEYYLQKALAEEAERNAK